MARIRVRQLAALTLVIALVLYVWRELRGEPTTAFDGPPPTVRPSPTGPGVDSADGTCPAERPVKGNTRSGIFHVPGGAMYARTLADRCYATPEAAEAEGLRRAKR